MDMAALRKAAQMNGTITEEGSQLYIAKPYAEIFEVKDLDEPNKDRVRVYPYSPGLVALQIRTHKGINDQARSGKPRDMVAHVTFKVEELETILAHAKRVVR